MRIIARLTAGSRTHLREAGESYFAHFRFATFVGAMTMGAGMACMLHALIPALCTGTASRTIKRLNLMLSDRSRLDQVIAESRDVLGFLFFAAIAASTAIVLLSLGGLQPHAVALSLLAFGFPAALLISNPELEALP